MSEALSLIEQHPTTEQREAFEIALAGLFAFIHEERQSREPKSQAGLNRRALGVLRRLEKVCHSAARVLPILDTEPAPDGRNLMAALIPGSDRPLLGHEVGRPYVYPIGSQITSSMGFILPTDNRALRVTLSTYSAPKVQLDTANLYLDRYSVSHPLEGDIPAPEGPIELTGRLATALWRRGNQAGTAVFPPAGPLPLMQLRDPAEAHRQLLSYAHETAVAFTPQ